MIATVVNELSVAPCGRRIEEAKAAMGFFKDLLVELANHGASGPVRRIGCIAQAQLADNYWFGQWMNDESVEREERSYIRSRLSRYAEVFDEVDEDELCEYYFEGNRAIGIGDAFRLSGIALSVPLHEKWKSAFLEVNGQRIDEHGEVESFNDKVRHSSLAIHVAVHSESIRKVVRNVSGPEELWDRRRELFKAIDFCDSIGREIRNWSSSHIWWYPFLSRLWELDRHFSEWQSGGFSPTGLSFKTTPEGPTTLGKYPECRTFTCPDGVDRLFSWHCRLTPGKGRVYFFPIEATRRAVIGYVGSKLPTVDYPT